MPRVRARRYLPRQLLVLLGALAVVLVVLAMPDVGRVPASATAAAPITAARAQIVEILERAPLDPNDPQGGFAPNVLVDVMEGPRAGERVGAYLAGPSG